MSLFDEEALRALIGDEIRRVIRDEIGGRAAGVAADEYLAVAAAAGIAAVTPATIRAWIVDGRLGRYHAGRELRVRRTELHRLLRTAPARSHDAAEATPEEPADQFIQRRRQSGVDHDYPKPHRHGERKKRAA
jgi:excisionase family DNA binding protein